MSLGPRASEPFGNRLLRALAPADLLALRPHLKRVSLPRPRVLETPRRRITAAYFIEDGFASVVSVDAKDQSVEVGIIGRDGVTGIPLLLGDDRWSHSTYMQIGGSGHSIEAADLRRCMAASPALNAALLRYVHIFLGQISATSTARALGSRDERLARWLLMAQDRVAGDVLNLTHEFLAMMLAVRRPGVTVALNGLVGRGLIETARGSIHIIECAGLLYGTAEGEAERLMRPA